MAAKTAYAEITELENRFNRLSESVELKETNIKDMIQAVQKDIANHILQVNTWMRSSDALTLRQEINAVRMTEEAHWATVQADLLKLKQEVSVYFTEQVKQEPQRTDPWRMPLEEFLGWRDGVKADWSDNGNAKTGQRLARALKRSSGHAEGQLYINWCGTVGRPAVKAFWIARGFKEIPEGL
jgi:uncharacterized protein YoxC